MNMRILLLGVLVVLSSGCAASRGFWRFMAGTCPTMVDEPSEGTTACRHGTGYKWENYVFRALAFETEREAGSAEARLDDVYVGVVQDVVAVLWAMQERGATFDVKMSDRGAISIDLLTPPQTDHAQGPLLSAVNQRIENYNAKNMMKEIQYRLAAMPIHEEMLEDGEIYEAQDHLFATMNELTNVRAGKELTFKLPEGTTRDDYQRLLQIVLVRQEADFLELLSFQGAMASVRLAFASIDDASGSSMANVAAVLDAVLGDREYARSLRERVLKDYPSADEERQRWAAEGDVVYQRLSTSARYTEWKAKVRGAENAKQFGRQLKTAGKIMGASTIKMYGVNKVPDLSFKDMSVDDLLVAAKTVTPKGSRLWSLLEHAEQVEAVVEQVGEVQADVDAGEALVDDAGERAKAVATSVARRTVKRLVLVHTPDEVRAVQERLQQLQRR